MDAHFRSITVWCYVLIGCARIVNYEAAIRTKGLRTERLFEYLAYYALRTFLREIGIRESRNVRLPRANRTRKTVPPYRHGQVLSADLTAPA